MACVEPERPPCLDVSSLPASFRSPRTPPPLVSIAGRFPDDAATTGAAFLVDKPLGWTSFDVCAKLRGALRTKRVGHAGTLDPSATGLLVVCCGPATRWVDAFQAQHKCYEGVLRLGEATPSLDAETEVSERSDTWRELSDEQLEAAAARLTGDLQQTPPMYSAIQQGGERLYEKARRGETVARPPRSVSVTRFAVSRLRPGDRDVSFEVDCSKGTYIRSLAADLGTSLGTHAHLVSLRRVAIGSLHVESAWDMNRLVAEATRSREDAARHARAESVTGKAHAARAAALTEDDAAAGFSVGVAEVVAVAITDMQLLTNHIAC